MSTHSVVCRYMWQSARAAVFCGVGWAGFSESTCAQELLWTIKDCAKEAQVSLKPRRNSSCSVEVKEDVLHSGLRSFAISRSEHRTLVLEAVRVVAFNRGFIWVGSVKGDPGSSATFSVIGKTVVGDVVLSNGNVVRLRRSESDGPVLEELERRSFPPGHPPRTADVAKGYARRSLNVLGREEVCGDLPDSIDLLVAYTAAALASEGGNVDAMEGRVRVAVEEANSTYMSSNVVTEFGLVAYEHRLTPIQIKQVDIQESDSIDADLDAVRHSDAVAKLRMESKADLVVLVTHRPGAAGKAYQLQNFQLLDQANFVDLAFAVVTTTALTGTYALAHEVGHLMGASHDADAQKGAYPYSHAFLNRSPPEACNTPVYGTLMNECSECRMLPRWSDPKATLDGVGCTDAMLGVPETSDAAKTLRNTGVFVAGLQCSNIQRIHFGGP